MYEFCTESFLNYCEKYEIAEEANKNAAMKISDIENEFLKLNISKGDVREHVWKYHVERKGRNKLQKTNEESWYAIFNSVDVLRKFILEAIDAESEMIMREIEQESEEIKFYTRYDYPIGKHRDINNPNVEVDCYYNFMSLEVLYRTKGDETYATPFLRTSFPRPDDEYY